MDLTKITDVFALRQLVDYEIDKIATKVVERNNEMMFILKAFDAGQKLAEHAAPGNAIVTVLEGLADIYKDGRTYNLAAGDSIVFPKGALHSVYAPQRMKLSLLIAEPH